MTATDPSVPVSGSALPVQRRPIFQAAAILAIATAFPAMVGFEQYMIYSGCIALIWVLLATGYNIVIGMCGQLTMSHIAFYGIGAYTSSLLVRDVGVPFPLAFVAAIILPTIGAWIMAKAAVKFTAAYLAMITFAFHSMCWMLFVNWQPVTNGWEGVLRIPPASVFGYTFDTTGKVYYLLLVVAALGVVAAARIKNSRVGRAFFAIRDNRLAAKGVGINTQRTITLGAAGSLMAHFVKYIDPTSFSLSPLIDLLVIVLIGGRGSVMGVAVAAVVFTFGLEYLRFLQDWRLMVFGALLLLLINFSPNGIGELGQRLKVRWIAYRSAK
jgi:branched-chain amino acid transport system permease protein